MVDDITPAFQRAKERYADGELVLLIDGSGGMPAAYNEGKSNAFVISVEYAIEAKNVTPGRVSAHVFGETKALPPLPLDGKEDPMRYCPCGPSYFTPAFDAFAKAYEDGKIGKPAHIVIISDGVIFEAPSEDKTKPSPTIKETLLTFLRAHPEVMFDMIVPGGGEFDELSRMTKEIALLLPDNPPRLFAVDSAQDLKKSIADVVNERNSGETLDQVAEKAVKGVDNASTMPALRFRKPENI